MAIILQYRCGELVPVKVDQENLENNYHSKSNTDLVQTAFMKAKKASAKKRMYGSLIMTLVICHTMLLCLAVKLAS